MKKVFISVVSHNNEDLILKNFAEIPGKYGDFHIQVCIIDNCSSLELRNSSKKLGFDYFSDGETRGYGGNNNKNFDRISIKEDDIFIVCNPDVTIKKNQIENILSDFVNRKADIYGVKVFESPNLSKWSSHNRRFPALMDPLISLVLKKKLFEQDVDSFSYPDWIGGAFMIFNAKSYKVLNGFDEEYFMYYEDTDICHRAKMKLGMKIIYNPQFYIVHEAQREGRKFLSKNFIWNLESMIKYFKKYPPKKLLSI